MGEPDRKLIALSRDELAIVVYTLAASQPENKETEVVQFRLYHRMLSLLNEFK